MEDKTMMLGALTFEAEDFGQYSRFWHNKRFDLTVFRDTARSWQLRSPGRNNVYVRTLKDLESVIETIRRE